MICHSLCKYHIRYNVTNNDEYHTRYDFMRVVYLSYPLRVSRRADPKRCCSGSPRTPPARSGPATQDVAVIAADGDAICCVSPLPRDRPLSTGNGRCGYSLTVVHFRKSVIRQKIGSAGNGHPVIYRRVYMAAYYQPENDDGREKSSG